MTKTSDLTCAEVAAELKTTARQVRFLIHDGQIAAYNIARTPGRATWRVRRSAVDAYKRAARWVA